MNPGYKPPGQRPVGPPNRPPQGSFGGGAVSDTAGPAIDASRAVDLGRTPQPTDEELAEQLRKQAAAIRPTLELLMRHNDGPLRLKFKQVKHLQEHIINVTNVAMLMEHQAEAFQGLIEQLLEEKRALEAKVERQNAQLAEQAKKLSE